MNEQQALIIKDLSYRYRKAGQPVIHQLSLRVKEGSRFGLFGPNGAGKTTLMNLMTGLLPYRSGSIQLFDTEIKDNADFVKIISGLCRRTFPFMKS